MIASLTSVHSSWTNGTKHGCRSFDRAGRKAAAVPRRYQTLETSHEVRSSLLCNLRVDPHLYQLLKIATLSVVMCVFSYCISLLKTFSLEASLCKAMPLFVTEALSNSSLLQAGPVEIEPQAHFQQLTGIKGDLRWLVVTGAGCMIVAGCQDVWASS